MPAAIPGRTDLPSPAPPAFAARDLYLVGGVSNLLLLGLSVAIAASNLRWAWSEASTSFVALAAPAAMAFVTMPFAALGLGALAAISERTSLHRRRIWISGLIVGSLFAGLMAIWVLAVIAGTAVR